MNEADATGASRNEYVLSPAWKLNPSRYAAVDHLRVHRPEDDPVAVAVDGDRDAAPVALLDRVAHLERREGACRRRRRSRSPGLKAGACRRGSAR